MGVEEEEAGPLQDLPHILKGKRTKRQRPQSPIPFTITTQYSPSGEAGHVSNGDCIINNDDNNNNNNDNDNDNNNNNVNMNRNSSSSSAEQAPSGDDYTAKTTEEDEYTAKCLILLAQGQRCKQHQQPVRMREPLRYKYAQDQDYGVPEKFNSKRYIETPISGIGKAGMYVYECKTCGRTFPSFQALGGHRASHKKPKNMAAEEKRLLMEMMSDDEDDLSFKNFNSRHNNNNNNRINYNYSNNNSSSLSLEFISSNNRGISSNSNTNNSNLLHKSASFPRIHQCSHCGAEFASGQALGGHMRRHRGAPAIANTTLSLGQLSPEAMDEVSDHEAKVKRVENGLSLDLNLPAPEDHDHLKESKFGLSSNQQQQRQQLEEKQPALVLSTNTKLVDCYY